MPENSLLPLRDVLASIARSPRAAAVAAEAHRIASLYDARVSYVHAGDDTPDVRADLTRLLESANIVGAQLDIVDEGASRTVCRMAEERDADLIVAGALEKEGALEYYVGSIARKIARKAPCSVLLLTSPALPPASFRTIVITIGTDDSSREALLFAIDLARREDAELHVVYEYELAGLRQGLEGGLDIRGEEHLLDSLHAEEEYRLVTYLDTFELEGIALKRACLHGRKGFECVGYARRVHAELLIFPTPVRKLGLWDKIFPHDVEFALQYLPCACMLYRPRGATSARED
jgi:nucleotide-binding universal stress UspA family protein